jgi:hypothetical protein
MDTEVYKLAERKPYAVQFGFQCEQSETFATFAEALLFFRGYLEAVRIERGSKVPPCRQDGPRIVNTDRHDGSEDGNYGGLTQEEREAVEEVG